MTNEEIIAYQRAAKAHREALPVALQQARNVLTDFNGQPVSDGEAPLDGLTAGHLRTLLQEIERLQGQVRQLNADMRDEQREARHAAGCAYSEGRHDGIAETRGW